MSDEPKDNPQTEQPAPQPSQDGGAAVDKTTTEPSVEPTTSSNEQVSEESLKKIKNFNTDDTATTDIYSSLISLPYKNTSFKSAISSFNNLKNSGIGGQIIDITNDYRWTMQTFVQASSASKVDYVTHDVPFCYAIEWRQNISSGIMNLINSLNSSIVGISNFANDALTHNYAGKLYENVMAVVGGLGDIFGVGEEAKGLINATGNVLGSAATEVSSWGWVQSISNGAANSASKAATAVGEIYTNVLGNINNPAKGSEFLKPYSLLYGMEETGKKYSFPMVNQPPKFNMGTNSFGDGTDTDIGNIHKAFGIFGDLAKQIPQFRRDLLEIAHLSSSQTASKVYEAISVEKAKYFNFPTNTNSYTVSFPLINTIAKDEWKKNYTFILLFILRNMIFRKDSSSYYPPLIYDLIIPGTTHEPYCYVQQVQVQPLGMMRSLSWDAQMFGALVGKGLNSNMTVFVPEVWMVTITFTSLLAPSANMVISSLTDLSISTKAK